MHFTETTITAVFLIHRTSQAGAHFVSSCIRLRLEAGNDMWVAVNLPGAFLTNRFSSEQYSLKAQIRPLSSLSVSLRLTSLQRETG